MRDMAPEPVSFITVERGADLIVALAIDLGKPGEIASLILHRTPKHDVFLPPNERGVRVSHEHHPKRDDEVLLEAEWSKDGAVIVSTERTYVLDLARVEKSDLRAARAVLKCMHFDGALTFGSACPAHTRGIRLGRSRICMSSIRSRTRGTSRGGRMEHVHQFLVVLAHADPLVWRRIQIPERYSFGRGYFMTARK